MSGADLAGALAGTGLVFLLAAYLLLLSTFGSMEPATRRFRGRAGWVTVVIALVAFLAAIWIGAAS